MKLTPNSIVIFIGPPNTYPFTPGEQLLFLGEITNMGGHGIFVQRYTNRKSDIGRVQYGYHTENFRMARQDEL